MTRLISILLLALAAFCLSAVPSDAIDPQYTPVALEFFSPSQLSLPPFAMGGRIETSKPNKFLVLLNLGRNSLTVKTQYFEKPAEGLSGLSMEDPTQRQLSVLANGSLAQYPEGGGHWSAFLQYLFGLSALGHDVFWLELLRTTGNPARDRKLIAIFLTRFHRYRFQGRCAVLLLDRDLPDGTLDESEACGMSKEQVKNIIQSADLVWDFCCTLGRPFLSLFKRRALIDLDPGLVQVPAVNRDWDVSEHEYWLTVGRKVGDADCQVPTLGLAWRGFLPFCYLPAWTVARDPGIEAPFTSVTQWTWDEIWHEGRVLSASKRQAFLRYVEIPQRTGRSFELAANIHPKDDTGDRELMVDKGWKLVHPDRVTRSPRMYQNYIKQSRAEFCCVKPIYRELNTGWFSDRSAAYLASGRPVLAEHTGFSDYLPTGRGLLCFNSMDEAIAGIADIDGNYDHHRRGARELAEEYFDSETRLTAMLSACGW